MLKKTLSKPSQKNSYWDRKCAYKNKNEYKDGK